MENTSSWFLKNDYGIPLYDGGAAFQSDVAHFVTERLKHPERVDSSLTPLSFMFAIFGRASMQKARCIRSLLEKEDNMVVAHVSVDDSEAVVSVQMLHTALKQAELREDDNKVHAIVIDHADRLFVDPDHQETVNFVQSLRAQAEASRCFIFACMDHEPFEFSGQKLPDSVRKFRQRVMRQFDVYFFVPAPPPSYRNHALKELWKQATEKWPHLKVDLSDEDYCHLDTYTSYAGPDEILAFVRTVLSDALFKGREKNPFQIAQPAEDNGIVTITLSILRSYLSRRSGRDHILRFDPRYEENNMSVLCGKAPVAGMPLTEEQKKNVQLAKRMHKVETPASTLKRGRAELEEDEDSAPSEKRTDVDTSVMEAFMEVTGQAP